ncbi:MAG: ATP-binding protein [Chthoniobacteraceae bacterium]
MATIARQFSIRSKVLIGFSFATIMLCLLALLALRSNSEFVRTSQASVNITKVLQTTEALMRAVRSAESSERGYIVTGDDRFLENYLKSPEREVAAFDALDKQSASLSGLALQVRPLKESVNKTMAILGEGINIRRTFGENAAKIWLQGGADEKAIDELRRIASTQLLSAKNALQQYLDTTEQLGRFTKVMILVVTIFALLLFVVGALTIVRDLKHRAEIERALAAERNLLNSLINVMPEYVYVKDLERRFILNNRSHLEILGASSPTEVYGKRSEDFFSAEQTRPYLESDLQILKDGISSFDMLYCWKDREGNPWWTSTTKVALRDEEGKITGLVGITSDVTKFKLVEEELRATAAQMERQNRELKDFAAVASHDLQEPLRKIMTFSDRLVKKCGEAMGQEGQDFVLRTMDAARRMQLLIQDLLKFSQIGSRELPFVPVDLGEVIWDVVSDLEVRIESVKAELKIGSLPEIEGDPILLRQLFQNLLTNAMKFQKPEVPPVISVQAVVQPYHGPDILGARQGDPVCKITVSDNGIGFDPKFSEQIFTIFQRLHSRDKYEGTGIGLAVVRRIVDKHGGTVEAHSIENEGATFHVTLPMKQTKKTIP